MAGQAASESGDGRNHARFCAGRGIEQPPVLPNQGDAGTRRPRRAAPQEPALTIDGAVCRTPLNRQGRVAIFFRAFASARHAFSELRRTQLPYRQDDIMAEVKEWVF